MLKRILYLVLCAITVLSPTIATVTILTLHSNATLYDVTPYWDDEKIYWHQIQSFQHVGFASGYHVYEEQPAAAQFSPFDYHGPWFPMILGTLARVTGWHTYSIGFYNLAFLSIALAIFIAVTRPFFRQLILLSGLMLTFWPTLHYVPLTMLEIFIQALAIVFAGICYRILRFPLSSRVLTLAFGFIIFMSLFRPTWSLLIIPILVISQPVLNRCSWLRTIIVSVVCVALCFGLYAYVGSPYPYGFLGTLVRRISLRGVDKGLESLWRNIQNNIALIGEGRPFEMLLRVQVLSASVILFVSSFIKVGQPTTWMRRWLIGDVPLGRHEVIFHLLNFGPLFVLNLMLYEIGHWRDYRLFAPHFLLSILVIIAYRRYTIATTLIIANLFIFSPALDAYSLLFNPTQTAKARDEMVSYSNLVAPHVRYDSITSNRWCNTVLVTHYLGGLAGLPAGIGFTASLRPDNFLQFPIKSHYVLFDDETVERLHHRLNLQPLVVLDRGTLYRNLDANCVQPSP